MKNDHIALWLNLALLLVIGCGSCAYGNYSCSSRASRMGLAYSWGPVEGCMVKTRQGWRPIEAIREIDP